jgi:phage tail sheath protein FI
MAEYLSPGVYVEEFDSSPRSIAGVGTSTAGFVGMAEKGPTIGSPSLVTSFADFERQFGSYLTEYSHGEYRYLAYAVEQFFTNGGTRCYVSRVVPEDAKIASAKQGILAFKAANEGKWGNRIAVSFVSTNRRKLQLIAKEADGIYTAKNPEGFREGDLVEFAGELNRIRSVFENTITFEKDFDADPVDTSVIPKNLVYSVEMDVTVRCDSDAEVYNGVTLNPTSPNYIAKRLAGSQMVSVTAEETDELANPVELIFGEGKFSGTVTLSGGSDGTEAGINADVFIGTDGGPGKRTGIQSFIENNVASIIAVPGVTIPEVIAALVMHCENEKNRFAVIDIPKELVKTGDVIEYRNMIDSTYAAMYHPWIQVFDRVTKKPAFIPPSGAVMGVFSRTDISRGVHKAPANEIISCTGLSINYTSAEQDILNPAGVNLIRVLPGQGIRVWGARTASSNSAFKYVNVRRLFIFVEQSIKASTNWVVFEPNNTSLWARVQLTISSFLEGLYRAGMLAGESSSEAYFVNIGTSTMSQDDILNGRLICEIGIAPSRPAEFVIFRITQYTAESGGGGE